MTNAQVFARFLRFQIPGMLISGIVLVLLVRAQFVSPAVGAMLFAFWVAKDLALYPLTKKAYLRHAEHHGAAHLIGACAVVERDLRAGEEGRVRVGAERWRARFADSAASAQAPAGSRVRIRAVRDLTLLVEPE